MNAGIPAGDTVTGGGCSSAPQRRSTPGRPAGCFKMTLEKTHGDPVTRAALRP
jgi:hypothetical protein